MKKTFFPVLAFLFLGMFFISCEKESLELNESQSASLTTGSTTKNPKGGNCSSEFDMYERQLHWFSATTVRVLRYHSAARTEVLNHLNFTGAETIDAELLLGDSTFNFPNFKVAFEDEFLYYLDPPEPETDSERPKVPPVQGGVPDGGPNDWIYDAYLTVLLDDNCSELYFPNGLFLWGLYNLTSTTHPLNSETCNEGIKRLHNPPGGVSSATSPVVVDANYLTSHENVIVARPVRSTGDASPIDPCLYNQYPGIDFTIFLD